MRAVERAKIRGLRVNSEDLVPESRVGMLGWLFLSIYVFFWDCLAPETLSNAFFRGVKHPFTRWPTMLLWGFTTLHLFHLIKPKYDPYMRFGALLTRSKIVRRR